MRQFRFKLIAGLCVLAWASVASLPGGEAEPPPETGGAAGTPSTASERPSSDVRDALRRAQQHLERAVRTARAEANLEGGGGMAPNRAVGPLVEHTRDEPFKRLKGSLASPIAGEQPTFDFGRRQQTGSVSYVRHTGLTWKVEVGTEVRSVADGSVAWVGEIEGYGPVIIINHGDTYVSLYAHLSSTSVDAGDEVSSGAVVGAVGEVGSLEGPKLYFELRRGEQPIDPSPWMASPAGGADAGSGEDTGEPESGR